MDTVQNSVSLTLHDVGRYLDSIGTPVAEEMAGAVNRALEVQSHLEGVIAADTALISELRQDQQRALAYPKLVDALREAVASFDQLVNLNRCPENMQGARISRALLHELGEARP